MTTTLLSLPLELGREILTYLEFEEIKQFSTLSSRSRNLALPVLFSKLKWRHSMVIRRFQEGGKFSHLRGSVRHVTIIIPTTVHDVRGTIELLHTYVQALCHFPRITSLFLNFSMIPQFEDQLIYAIFTNLSTAPIFYTLRSLNFTFSTRLHNKPSGQNIRGFDPQVILEDLPQSSREFLETGSQSSDDVYSPPYPPGLTEAVISIPHFSFVGVELRKQMEFSKWSQIIQCSNSTLRRLRIRTGSILSYINPSWKHLSNGTRVVYPNMTQLQLDLDYFSDLFLHNISRLFPSLQDLVIVQIDTTGHLGPVMRTDLIVPSSQVFGALTRMKSLKRIRLPTLYDMSGVVGEQTMRRAVLSWLDAGLVNLEKVAIAHQFNSGGTNRKYLQNSSLDRIEIYAIKRGIGKDFELARYSGWGSRFYYKEVEQHSLSELFYYDQYEQCPNRYLTENWFS